MTHVLMIEHSILECEDFSYSEGDKSYKFCDHAEGECIRIKQSEFIRIIAETLAEDNEEEVGEDHYAVAVNLLANSTKTGRAAFLYGLM